MLKSLWRTVKGWLYWPEEPGELSRLFPEGRALSAAPEPSPTPHVPYDEGLLERARTQWQFGDWDSLAVLTREQIQHHPDRAKLVLLAAAGLLQLGRAEEARALTRQALDWGCSPRLVRQTLVSGVHNSLARTCAILGQEQQALAHFKAAIAAGTPHADRLVGVARASFQLNQLGQVGVTPTFQVGWNPPEALSEASSPSRDPIGGAPPSDARA